MFGSPSIQVRSQNPSGSFPLAPASDLFQVTGGRGHPCGGREPLRGAGLGFETLPGGQRFGPFGSEKLNATKRVGTNSKRQLKTVGTEPQETDTPKWMRVTTVPLRLWARPMLLQQRLRCRKVSDAGGLRSGRPDEGAPTAGEELIPWHTFFFLPLFGGQVSFFPLATKVLGGAWGMGELLGLYNEGRLGS